MAPAQRLTEWVPQPEPTSLDKISPTLLATYSDCPARAGYEKDPSLSSMRRLGLRAALGIVAHAVIERNGCGATFEEVWAEEADKVYEELCRQWTPASPPSPYNWPGFALTATRLSRLWSDTAEHVPAAPRTTQADGPSRSFGTPVVRKTVGPLPWREEWIEHKDAPIVGKPDLVRRADGILEVIDLKTGKNQSVPSENQRDQLLLYCALVESALGEMPSRAGIMNADGLVYYLPFTSADVADVMTRAESALRVLQEAANGPTPLPARPSEDICVTCPFKSVCPDFLSAYQPDWRCSNVRVGRVLWTGTVGATLAVDIAVTAPAWAPERMRLIGFPFPQSVATGEVWGLSDFEGASATGMARWNTLVVRWPEDRSGGPNGRL